MINTIEASKIKMYPANGLSIAGTIVKSIAMSFGRRYMFAMGLVLKTADSAPNMLISASELTTPAVMKTLIIPPKRITPIRSKKIARGSLSFILLYYVVSLSVYKSFI